MAYFFRTNVPLHKGYSSQTSIEIQIDEFHRRNSYITKFAAFTTRYTARTRIGSSRGKAAHFVVK